MGDLAKRFVGEPRDGTQGYGTTKLYNPVADLPADGVCQSRREGDGSSVHTCGGITIRILPNGREAVVDSNIKYITWLEIHAPYKLVGVRFAEPKYNEVIISPIGLVYLELETGTERRSIYIGDVHVSGVSEVEILGQQSQLYQPGLLNEILAQPKETFKLIDEVNSHYSRAVVRVAPGVVIGFPDRLAGLYKFGKVDLDRFEAVHIGSIDVRSAPKEVWSVKLK